jgi:signal transduction histidine kinase
LKAPLRVIDNASRWLEEDLATHPDEESRENMQLLRSRVSRMGKLLDDMLEYSLIGSKMTNRPTEMIQGDLLIKDVLFLLAPPAGFSVTYGKEFGTVKLPKFFIQRVLMNLICNAIKHHKKKEGNISLSLKEDPYYYAIIVADDGPGIAPQFHAQVFKMFHTLKPRDKVEGSGMGLAMLMMTAVIEFTYMHFDVHIEWALMLGLILFQGPGKASLDALIKKNMQRLS